MTPQNAPDAPGRARTPQPLSDIGRIATGNTDVSVLCSYCGKVKRPYGWTAQLRPRDEIHIRAGRVLYGVCPECLALVEGAPCPES